MRQSRDRLPLDDDVPGTHGVEKAQRVVDDYTPGETAGWPSEARNIIKSKA
jgi:hypothetical protein